ncbi:MAG: anaerobic ribonucleoside-triphosphate reductase activating protein [Leptothrix sp. (in: Bacteria)]|nr:anaerobic ribonucleoside-triphosphate reductase activating protein [Leptothrix sp. (in: b-proteobacteria)]
MVLGGFTPLSTTDWPGKLAAVVFLQGCPWRCGYCHNAGLQPRCASSEAPRWPDVLATLQRRVGLLDGVVFSGGEPTLQRGLGGAVAEVRARGLRTGLHTAGIYPERLSALLPALDWVGFDLKTDLADAATYDALTGARHSAAAVRRSLEALLACGVEFEVRTTYHPRLISDDALLGMAQMLQDLGIRHWVLQRWQANADPAQQPLVPAWCWPQPLLQEALHELVPGFALR